MGGSGGRDARVGTVRRGAAAPKEKSRPTFCRGPACFVHPHSYTRNGPREKSDLPASRGESGSRHKAIVLCGVLRSPQAIGTGADASCTRIVELDDARELQQREPTVPVAVG